MGVMQGSMGITDTVRKWKLLLSLQGLGYSDIKYPKHGESKGHENGK